MWDRQDVDFIQSQDVPWTVVPDGHLATGDRQRVLSITRDQATPTVLLKVRNVVTGTMTSGADIFVLAGRGRMNGEYVQPGAYLFLPRDEAAIHIEPDGLPLILFVGYLGPPDFQSSPVSDGTLAQPRRIDDLPWAAPEWNGDKPLLPGVFVKWLRRAGPEEVCLAAMLPGWRSDLEERHPVHEESFRLAGDLVQGTRGLMRPGAYSYRSPGVWHCPMGTFGGTVSLIRSSAPTTTEYREPLPGMDWKSLVQRAYAGESGFGAQTALTPSSSVWP